MKVFFPNLITSLNLLCGLFGIVFVFSEHIDYASCCILLAAVFDFLDGFLARLLKVNGDFGKQLDSLADLVTFGVLPALILFQMVSIGYGDYYIPFTERPIVNVLAESSTLLVALFSAFRLAKFNLDSRQSYDFIGLPTPANALFVSSFALLLDSQYHLNMYSPISEGAFNYLADRRWYLIDQYLIQLLFNPTFYIIYTLIVCYLLISELPVMSMKFKSWTWSENVKKYIFLLGVLFIAVVCLYYDKWAMIIFFSFLWLILVSLVLRLLKK